MTDSAILAAGMVLISALATVSFHSWLRQRERERLTGTDKAELSRRLDDVDGRIRELKSAIPRRA